VVISRAAAAQPVTYVFVDAGHLRPNFDASLTAWVGKPVELDVAMLRLLFGATKTFYYDSIDDVPGKNETAEQVEQRVHQQEAKLKEINSIPNTHVRFGSVTGGDRRKRRQKEVDILIAVDMMNHAVRQNMERAVLLSGDRDFTPLVETLVQFGLTVGVAGDFRSTSDILAGAADYYQPLGVSEYSQLAHQSFRSNLPKIPSFSGGSAPRSSSLEANGAVGKFTGKVFSRTPVGFFVELSDRYGSSYTTVETIYELERLALFFRLQHGDVPWLDQLVARLKPSTA
jgi:uncharacterized LabA/DUF88 family protein